MTAPRFKSRSRFVIGFGLLMLMLGFIAIFNSQNVQIDESRILRLRCLQEQEALNARLQAIVDHKFRLEKSLEETRLKEKVYKEDQDRKNLASHKRFESLQQHYKLLQSEHQDSVESCAKNKGYQLQQINDQDHKIKNLQNQLEQMKLSNNKENSEWKAKLDIVMKEKNLLDIEIKNYKSRNQCNNIEQLLNEYKMNCNYNPKNKYQQNQTLALLHHNHRINEVSSLSSTSTKATNLLQPPPQLNFRSFDKQELVSNNLYKINILDTTRKIPTISTNKLIEISSPTNLVKDNNNNNIPKDYKNNNLFSKPLKLHLNDGIINSVENFQIAPKPIISSNDVQPAPPILSSSTAAEPNKQAVSPRISSAASSSPSKLKTSSTATNFKDTILLQKPKQLPNGVPPVPDMLIQDVEDSKDKPTDNKSNNNRYSNVVNELTNEKKIEDMNAANEVKDEIVGGGGGGGGGEGGGVGGGVGAGGESLNNAAEDELGAQNFFDTKLNNDQDQQVDNNIEVIGAPAMHRFKKQRQQNEEDDVALIDNGDNKLINELVRDQGKDFPINEEPEEDEDEDDYSNLAARQQEGAAIRN